MAGCLARRKDLTQKVGRRREEIADLNLVLNAVGTSQDNQQSSVLATGDGQEDAVVHGDGTCEESGSFRAGRSDMFGLAA